jgi:hypothetical protein
MKCKKSMVFGGLIAISTVISLSVFPTISSADSDQSFTELEQSRGLPVRGTSISAVLAKYGEPESRSGPVGDPPISTWRYADFSVYIEYKHVITSVSSKDYLPQKLIDIQ